MNHISFFIQQNKFLSFTILANLLLFAICLVLMNVDKTQILGISRWTKPSKFAISIAIYLLTIAYILSYFPANHLAKAQNYAFWFALLMLVEIICITIQAIRGETSHYNITSGFNILMFNLMGIAILINTIFLVLLTKDFFVLSLNMPADMLWAVRLGLILMLLGSLESGLMLRISQHTVGQADGGAGLPYLNWSTVAGDLRVAHFVGLHALQILIGLVLLNQYFHFFTSDFSKITLVSLMSLLILSIFVLTAWQALAGRAFLR
jgi:hypothetical protein